MPIRIDRAAARTLAPRLNEALELVCNEFDGLDTHRQYRNAFARLLKPDPLKRVSMMGTNQRDLFVPELRRAITRHVPDGGHMLDLGAGDGQTFALVADAVPNGTRVSVEEPNPGYLSDYVAFLEAQQHLVPGMALQLGFDEIDAAPARFGQPLPADGSIHLCMALHMVYFVDDVAAGLVRMMRFVKPGGALFVVLTDENDNYTGRVLREYILAGGDTGANDRHLSSIAERRRLLCPTDANGSVLKDALGAAGIATRVAVKRQASRLYGHSLADLIALSSIATLSNVDGTEKFEAAAGVLRDSPEAVDLRIEDRGPRKGMWSVAQPQWICVVQRTD